jgi:coenzyme F420-reducing hydrogenase delta subunit
VCPYGAAELARRPGVHPAACEGCGICAAECPRRAIRVPGLTPGEIRSLLDNESKGPGPSLTVFACTRSGGPALRETAAAAHWAARINVVEVPCAGGLDREALVAAFERGADGVMVLTCHDGNCHSRTGNRLARARVEHVQAFLGACGRDGRLQLRTTAANMPAEAERALTDFASALITRTRTAEGRDHA